MRMYLFLVTVPSRWHSRLTWVERRTSLLLLMTSLIPRSVHLEDQPYHSHHCVKKASLPVSTHSSVLLPQRSVMGKKIVWTDLMKWIALSDPLINHAAIQNSNASEVSVSHLSCYVTEWLIATLRMMNPAVSIRAAPVEPWYAILLAAVSQLTSAVTVPSTATTSKSMSPAAQSVQYIIAEMVALV